MTRRVWKCLLLAGVGCSLALAIAADPGPSNIPPEKLKQAETTYQEVFGATHAKLSKSGKLIEKAEFAKKLYERSKESAADPALAEVLRKNALAFVQNDLAGLNIAQEIHRLNAGDANRRLHSLEKLAELQEKSILLSPVADRPKLAVDIVKSYRDLALEAERSGNAVSAQAAITKARTLARKYIPLTAREIYSTLDSDERRYLPLATEQTEVEKLKVLVEKNPEDAKSRLSLAVIYLRRGKLPEAMDQLTASPNADLSQIAKLLAAKPVDPQMVANAARKAAGSLPMEDRKNRFGLLEFARIQFDALRLSSTVSSPKLQEEYLALLEQIIPLEPVASQGKHSMLLTLAYLEQAEELTEKRKPGEALAMLGKARGSIKGLRPTDAKDLLSDIDSQEKAVKAKLALEANAAKWMLEGQKAPLDAKTNLAYGIALLRLGRLPEAAAPLAAAESKAWQNLGKLLAELEQTPALALGDALRLAANELKGDEKAEIMTLCRDKYEAYIASSPKDQAELNRVMLILKEMASTAPRFGTDKNPALVDLFADDAQTAKLLKEGNGSGKFEVTLVRGQPAIATTGDFSQITIPADKPIVILENPSKPGEYRYCGFWIRKDGKGTDYSVSLRRENAPEVRYSLAPYSRSADATSYPIAGSPPEKWVAVQRDLFADFGGPAKLTMVLIWNRDPEGTTWLSHLHLARSAGQVRKALNATKPE